ncbi:2Fe-2S iron-sulfur cluster-binding protein [uncultured Aliiroseovarius sp.]|uniref:2Fe-2S iron-sulfur cluster-binding protein n=1 Tax=uncultured Aliiroseovarius sp. TaxID=1658783 RepID=UPI002635C0B9|nr:2Fe-2S iron-sulfur cluster-binding protein [uncultured Aliiroseovarius sp.]
MSHDFHKLTVASITPEIDGAATSVVFNVPDALQDDFTWTAGQHLTLRFAFDGEEERRSYTISNPPGAELRITVKRVKGGKVSNHIGDALNVGDEVEVMPPFGGFTLTPGATARRTHYFFGAGSGITPLYAMINAVMTNEPFSVAHLVYGNADAQSIIFQDSLSDLTDQHPDRLTVRHVLSSPSLWSWFTPWRTGRVDAAAISVAISETPPEAQDVQYWICGPGSMNGDVKSILMGLDVPADRIHMESFGGAGKSTVPVTGSVAATAQITLNGVTHEVVVGKGQTVLQAALTAGVDIPFSCQSGVCGACKAHLSEGKVHMSARMALEDDEVANNEILCCQSFPLTDRLNLSFGP